MVVPSASFKSSPPEPNPPVAIPAPQSKPREREKLRLASTILASIKTCGVWVSIALTSAVASWITDGMSLMMSVFVRLSTLTVPLGESNRETSSFISVTSA